MKNYRQKQRLEAAQRSTLMNLIEDIVNCGEFKSRPQKVTAFACLYVRIVEDMNDISRITRYASANTNEAADGFHQYKVCMKINARIHRFLDDDDDYVFNQSTGTLSSKWKEDIQARAQALEAAAPPGFFPTKEPVNLKVPYHESGVNLINTKKQAAYQKLDQMPLCYKAINILHKQRYKLAPVIINIQNLPIALETTKNYALLVKILESMDNFKDSFSFTYTMDYRGRVYARSLLIHPQGDSFSKACIEFEEAKPLGWTGEDSLKIHYANVSGHDKLSFKDRLEWAETKGMIKAYKMAEANSDWLRIEPLLEDHKHGFQEYAAAMEVFNLDRYKSTGAKASTFLSRIVCHQDATNSGFQFGAALTGDSNTAKKVNLYPIGADEKPEDLYNEMAANLQMALKEKEAPWMKDLPMINRSFCKKPIMVTGYGAGLEAVMNDIEELYPEQFKNSGNGSLSDLGEKLKPFIEEALELTASSMKATTKVMHSHGKELMDEGETQIKWTTPDGFKVTQEKRDNSGRRIELSNKQVVLEKREKGKPDPIDQEGMTKSLPPNFIHSMDAQMLRTAAIKADEENIAFCPIHDSFGTHASTFANLNMCLKKAFIETMDYDWYGTFCKENKVEKQDIQIGDYQTTECLQSSYMFS